MPLRLKILSILIGVSLFIYIIELVRRRKLREEYAWLWLLAGLTIALLSIWHDILSLMSTFLGGIFPSAVLFLFGLIFLLLINLHQSVKISKLTDQIKELSQEIAVQDRIRKNKE